METSPLLARMLEARGFTEQDEIEKFLNPDLDRDWTNPLDIKGMEKLAAVVESACKAGKRILIYGDYDIDGISATVVMMRGLMAIDKHINSGMQVDYFLPSRFEEGYGITEKSLERLFKLDPLPELIITVDCGITASKEIEILKSKGIDVVVTDHHEKSDNQPKDIALIDPEAEEGDSPNSILAGVSVALKFIQCLGSRLGLPHTWRDYIDLATLGTLGDVMPLVDQNRALVFEGLKMINENPRPAIRAILDVVGKKPGDLKSGDVSYLIIPRLNAAGRMDKANLAVDLLMSDDYAQSYNFALELESYNSQRREITSQMLEQATYRAKQIVENSPDIRCLVLSDKEWHPGVLGIVAAKIAETYNLPSIVMTIKDGLAHGSGRSVGDVDLHEACMKSFDKFEKFGGHKGACGLTIKESDVSTFSENLNNFLHSLDPQDFKKTYDTDIEVNLHELRVEDVESLDAMEPFGNKNEAPCFLTKNVFIKRAKAVGQDNNHLSCQITDGAYGGQGIMFNVSDIDRYLSFDGTVLAIYTPKVEEFQGSKNVKMHMKAIIPSSEAADNRASESSEYVGQLFENYKFRGAKKNSVGDFIKNSVFELNADIIDKPSFDYENNSKDARDKFSNIDDSKVYEEIIKAMIGEDGKLHDSQNKTLELLEKGKSVLSVMPTGRGKSLIFQTFASKLALKDKKMSIFIYPLRALISDQAFHLQKNLEKFGLSIFVLNGETPNEEREKIYQKMNNRQVDIMLTTPEFLAIHIDKIAACADVSFIVVDEAHHLGQVKIGERSAYGHMPKILEKLNNPQVLALSATVNDEVCSEIQKFLPIDEIVKDNFERENLFVDDRRNIKCRDDYLVSLCASGEKTVIYVNSRQQTVDLARVIKSRAPHIAMQVAFYNAGMSKPDRKKIETLFRDNELSVLVATSAFGEGVNIPDIRHVCLYHLPFSNIEFNQMAGRCGRDNAPAIIHLLYNRADATINTQILESSNPGRDSLAKIYMWINSTCENFGGSFEICHDQLMEMYEHSTIPAAPGAILCAMDIFSELGIINVETLVREAKTYSKIAIVDMSSKVELDNSSRFCEGQNEVNNFENYRLNAMRKTADDLTQLLRHPILPSELG